MGQDIDMSSKLTSLHSNILYDSLAFPLSCRVGSLIHELERFTWHRNIDSDNDNNNGHCTYNAISFHYDPCRSFPVSRWANAVVRAGGPSIHPFMRCAWTVPPRRQPYPSFFLFERDRETQEQWMSIQHLIVRVMVVTMTLSPSLHSPLLCCFLFFFFFSFALFAYISSISFMMKMIVWYI